MVDKLVDVERIFKNVIKKGKVKIGARQTKLAMQNKSAHLVIISKNCPYAEEIMKISKETKIPVYDAEFTGVNLGIACGKNFSVSVFAVLDEGDSNVMQLVKKRKS